MTGATDTALLTAIMQAAVDAIIISDGGGTILRASAAADRLFDYEDGQLIGQSINTLMTHDHADTHDGFMTHYLNTGEKSVIDIRRDIEGRRRTGDIFPLHVSVGHTRIGGEDLFVATLHDLTQSHASEDALTRTQRLDAVGQMTGGIAHDFNNLLTVIIGNLELLGLRCTDEKTREFVEDAQDAAELGADLISRLKVFARKGDLKPVATDLREVCNATISLLKTTLGGNYAITTDFDDNTDTILVDQSQLQSAIVNLVMNAVDAMHGSGELAFSISNVVIDDAYIAQELDISPGAYVRLSVSDTGDGMDREAQRRAFEPFFSTKADGGTGLGLAMVHGFLRQSGGHITLYSEPGIGTSFGLYFPARFTMTAARPPTVPTDARTQRWLERQILIVEDDPQVLKLSLKRIRDLGLQTHQATSADQAYALLQAGLKVDVVFTDIVMPGKMSGYDLAAKIKAEFPTVKLLITSGYTSDIISAKLPHDVSFDVLHKPYRQADLVSRLAALLADES